MADQVQFELVSPERLLVSRPVEMVVVPGGHVGAVVGSRAPKVLYPAMRDWLRARLATTEGRQTCN